MNAAALKHIRFERIGVVGLGHVTRDRRRLAARHLVRPNDIADNALVPIGDRDARACLGAQ